MVQVALAPCSPFSVTPELMRATAELAERLDVRLHTHLAEDVDEDTLLPRGLRLPPGRATSRTSAGAPTARGSRTASTRTRTRSPASAAWGTGVAHCPSSNQMIGAGLAPVRELRAAGVPVGIGCDGSASTDSASLWMESRNALLLARLRHGPEAMQARDALDMATRGGAACLGRDGRDRHALARARAATWSCGRSTASRSPARCPTRSRPGCAAGRPPPATRSSPDARSSRTAAWSTRRRRHPRPPPRPPPASRAWLQGARLTRRGQGSRSRVTASMRSPMVSITSARGSTDRLRPLSSLAVRCSPATTGG